MFPQNLRQAFSIMRPALRCAGRRLIPDEAAPLYRPWQTGAAAEPAEITLVPYFAWNNRQEGEMRVWLRT